MIRKGFIFNHGLCVGCKACSAACMLENGWKFKARTIYSANADAFVNQPVINLSMACNHCSNPVCLKGCPASAYYTDKATGAVLISPEKCFGCRYCIWNCPYDAPKFNSREGIIEKCNFCFKRVESGFEPACSSACPTGALAYGEIPEQNNAGQLAWLPPAKINPSVHFAGPEIIEGPEIIPAIGRNDKTDGNEVRIKTADIGWSLVAFSFLSTLSVSFAIASVYGDLIASKEIVLFLLLLAGLFSLFHLEAKLRSWRAILNVFSSPLSREICMYIIFTALFITGMLFDSSVPSILIPVTGLVFLLSIDAVYHFPRVQSEGIPHSGQTFLSGLLMISFFTGSLIPFLFIALIKLFFSFAAFKGKGRKTLFSARFIRIALLFLTSVILIKSSLTGRGVTLLIFVTGELIDRILFYADFRPVSIRDTINI